jgi:hypothetical protein
VASLVTIGVGLSPLLLGKRSPPVIATHAYCMTWSYAGLVAAGCGQLVVAVGHGDAAWVVPAVIGTVLSISGVVIFGRVPSTLDHMLAEEHDDADEDTPTHTSERSPPARPRSHPESQLGRRS